MDPLKEVHDALDHIMQKRLAEANATFRERMGNRIHRIDSRVCADVAPTDEDMGNIDALPVLPE